MNNLSLVNILNKMLLEHDANHKRAFYQDFRINSKPDQNHISGEALLLVLLPKMENNERYLRITYN